MPEYIYTARDKKGTIKRGILAAPSEHSLAETLREQGLILTHFDQKGGKKNVLGGKRSSSLFGSASLIERVLFTKHLQIMIKSGLSIARALSILEQQTANKKFKQIIKNVELGVEKGQTLATSLSKYPKEFPEVYVNMVKVGEASGRLEESLEQLAAQMKKDYDLINKVRGAMMYPAVVLTLMVGVVILVVVYVLPRLTSVFKSMTVDLPITTRMLIGLSEFVEQYGIILLIGIILFIVLVILYGRSKSGKPKFHTLYLRTPILGKIVKKINLARFARTSSSLIKSGVPIIKVLQIVSGVLGNIQYKNRMLEASKEVKKGKNLSDILSKDRKLFSPVVTQMIAIGEETGTIEDILEELADYYESDVENTMDNLSSILEPVMLIILGLGAGVIAVSVIAPIYSLVNQI